MPVKMIIKVTSEILSLSRDAWCGDGCAIELAVKSIFPDASVSAVSIFPFGVNALCPQIPLPYVAQDFIRTFDVCQPEERVELMELDFTISIPDEIIEKIDIEVLRPLLENHPTLQLV